jgi:hypothetical protein
MYLEGIDNGQKTPRGHPGFNSFMKILPVLVFRTDRQMDGQTDREINPVWASLTTLLQVQVPYGKKHNSTMVSDASPGTAAPKMNKSFSHMACVCSNRPCAQDGYLKCPHLIIIDGDMWWDSGWVMGGFGVGGHRTCD